MANFAFISTQKWVHTRSLTGQEYNVLQPELKVSIVPMDSSSSRCIGRGVPEFDARVDIIGRGLGQRLRENFGILKLKVWMEANIDNYSPCLEHPKVSICGSLMSIAELLSHEVSVVITIAHHLSSPLGLKYSDQLVSNQYPHLVCG